MPRAAQLAPVLLLGLIGCGPVSSAGSVTPATAKSAPAKEEPKLLWSIDPAPAKGFHETCRVGDYRLPIPESFGRAEDGHVPGFLTMQVWADIHDHDAIIYSGVFSGAIALEASNEMPKLLEILTKATERETNYKLVTSDPFESNEMLGCKFTRLGWTGTARGDQPARGASYGAFDGENVIIICLMACGDDAQQRLTKLEAGVVSLKKD